jgi:hypothetical protein
VACGVFRVSCIRPHCEIIRLMGPIQVLRAQN